MKRMFVISLSVVFTMAFGTGFAAEVVPNEIKMPGTQPNEVQNFESPDKCDVCHSGYDEVQAYSNEPPFGWRGSAMGNAGRDPIFWATLAVAEQDFDGAGDLCIRCHSAGGWMAGRSTPTDGSGLGAGDDNGVDCDSCHKATNPDNSEHLGVMNPPFVANKPNPDDPDGIEGYYGSGILSIWDGCEKLGPYNNAESQHPWMQSQFHRGDMCGSCHDVSNPAVGDLAPGNGTQPGAPPVISSNGNLGGPVDEKAAFNNPPYAYGIVERTFSEWKSSILDDMPVSNFPNLPADLQVQGGALHMAYQSALLAGQGGNFEDGTVRTFTCQSCHMRPDIGKGCNNQGVLIRGDMPTHDLAGGNYWMWPLIKYQDQQGTLRFGGGLTATQIAAMDAGQIRAQDQLRMAASLTVTEDTVKVTNLTGHKLITGFAEGRRMWLNMKWYDGTGTLLREDGKYGPLKDANGTPVTFQNPRNPGQTFTPHSIKDLYDPNTRIYEAHYSLTQGWSQTLMAVNAAHYGPIVLSYDRYTGAPEYTIADLAAGNVPYETYHESFHFVLNNYVNKDTRIPPYGMEYDVAKKRNALPVPASQYGNPGAGGTYDYFDVVQLNPPEGATGAHITLYYQGTSWEYIQFLWNANNGQNAFLGQEGVNMLDAWLNADPAAPMVPPFVMATATWGDCIPTGITDNNCNGVDDDCDGTPDDEYTPTPTNCGTGVCEATGQRECHGGREINTCLSGLPSNDQEATCNDGLDNDCDGFIDMNDTADCGADEVPPPVNQDIGILDTVFNNLVEADCRFCHEGINPDINVEGRCSETGEVCFTDNQCPGATNLCEDVLIKDRHHLLALTPEMIPNPESLIFNGKCSVTTTTICSTDANCPTGETCNNVPLPNPSVSPTDADINGDGQRDMVYGCNNCHPDNPATPVIDFTVTRDCLQCHVQIGGQGSVHHITATSPAQENRCFVCHGDVVNLAPGYCSEGGGITLPSGEKNTCTTDSDCPGAANTCGDGHVIPTYEPSLVTPSPSGGDGLPLNRRGNGAGACNYCHDSGTTQEGLVVETNRNTHHGTGFFAQGRCDWCHGSSAFCEEPLYDIRTCENCHGYESLHNVQANSDATGEVDIDGDGVLDEPNAGDIYVGAENPYFGHVGNNDDCLGCHGDYIPANAPGTGPVTPYITGYNVGVITAGADKAVTLTGSAFTNYLGTYQFTSNVTLTASDGSSTTLAADAIDESSLTVTIPGTTAPRNYDLRVAKDDGTGTGGTVDSNPVVISVIPNVAITTVDCNKKKGMLTVTGTGFGDKPAGTDADLNLQVDGQTVELISWSDTQIKGSVDRCSNRAAVTVNALFGSASNGKPCKGKKCR